MPVTLDTGLPTRVFPDWAVFRDTLYVNYGQHVNCAYGGDSWRRNGIRRPKVLREDFAIGANYTAGETTLTLDADANDTDDYYIGATVIVDSDEALITDYDGTTKVATLAAALSGANSYTGGTDTYCIHQKFALATSGGGTVTDGDHYVQVTFYDAEHDIESSPTQLPLNDDWGTRDFNKITTASQDIVVSQLPKPRDTNVTHWIIYMTAASSGTVYYRVDEVEIGTWAATDSYTISMDDTELAAQVQMSDRRDPFYTMSHVSSGKARLIMGGQARYATGTIAVTNGSRIVTLSGGTWSEAFEDLDMVIDVGGDSPKVRRYTIISVDASDRATLDSAYEGTSRSAAEYAIVGYARTIFFSDFDTDISADPTPEGHYRAGDYIQLGTERDETIRAIVAMGEGDQLVFTDLSMFRMTGEDQGNFTSPMFIAGLGVPTHRAILNNVEGLVFVLTPAGGVWATTGQAAPQEVSRACPTLFDANTLELSKIGNACAAYDSARRVAHFSVTPTNEVANRETRNWYAKTRAWTRYDLVDAQSIAELEDSDGTKHIYSLDASGFLLKWRQQVGDKVQSDRHRGVAESGSTTSLTDTTNTFTTTADGEKGVWVTFLTGNNAGSSRRIYSNTATTLTWAGALEYAVAEGDVYHLGCIPLRIETGHLDLGGKGGFAPSDYKRWDRLFLHCEDQASDYSTGQIILKEGYTTATGVGTSWSDSYLGASLLAKGYGGLFYVKAVTSTTALTLDRAWTGPSGGYDYWIGPRVWKISAYPDYSDDAIITRYVTMDSGFCEVALNFRAQVAKFLIETYDDPTGVENPFRLRSIELEAF